MVHGIIVTENAFLESDVGVVRGTGAHRIASHLRNHGYRIEVVDFCLRWSSDQLLALCENLVGTDTFFLGVGSNLFTMDHKLLNFLTEFRQRWPNIKLILGGNNLLSQDVSNFDYLVEGYAEQAMPVLLDWLQGRCSDAPVFSNISPSVPLIDAVKDYGHYSTSDLTIRYLATDMVRPDEALSIETARGCVFKCAFCTYPLIGKKKFDYMRDPDTIVAELETNYREWGTKLYIISEDTFNDRIEKLEILADAIDRLSFQPEFVTYARADLVFAQPQSMDLFKRIGIRGVHFGIETFTKSAGKLIGKGSDPDRLQEGLLTWKQRMPEVQTHCSMIMGLPGDDPELHAVYRDWFETSGIEFYKWSPLWITNTEKTLHVSKFSQEYRLHGLVPMTDDEIEREVAINHEQGIYAVKWERKLDYKHQDKILYWKNVRTGYNYFSALRDAMKMNALSKKRKVGPWSMFQWAGLGYSLDEMQTWGWHDVKPHVPEAEMQQRARDIIANYIDKKINFDYQNFYQQPVMGHSGDSERVQNAG
jgi:hypothetical protein